MGAGQVTFTNTSTDNINFTSQWYFYNAAGQFSSSTQTNPTVTFTGQQPYSATLIIIDSVCADTLTQVVHVINCLTLQGGAGKAIGADLEDFYPSQNADYTTYTDFVTSHWTHNGTPTENRGLLKFDFSQIPPGSTILSAALSLYADVNSGLDITGSPTYGTNNASILARVTSPWNPATVNWNSQPTVSTANAVSLPQSTSVNQDYLNLDISGFVQGWVNNPAGNYGMLLQMITQNHYNTLIFCSPGYADSTKWPRLDICYQVGSPCHLAASFTQQNLGNHNIQFTNTSTITNSSTLQWIFYDANGVYTTSTATNPVINFSGAYPFSATLQITDTTTGCTDSSHQVVNIAACSIYVSFSYQNLGNNQVQFTNLTNSNQGYTCSWIFSNANGPFTTSTQVNPLITFTGPAPYYALLTAADSVSRSCIDSFSTLVKVIVTTGVYDPSDVTSDLNIFPNPNNGRGFNVTLPAGFDAQTTQVRVLDVLGREVQPAHVERYTDFFKLALGDVSAAGIYTIALINNNRQKCGKLVVVR